VDRQRTFPGTEADEHRRGFNVIDGAARIPQRFAVDWARFGENSRLFHSAPAFMVFDGTHIWVGNETGNSVTELNVSDGSKVGTFTGGGDIGVPGGLAFDGAHIWVANSQGNSVDKL
jgi:hypothetical protein